MVPAGTTRNLRMQARLFAVKRVHSPDGSKAIAVIVLESLNMNLAKEDELKRHLDEAAGDLSLVVTTLRMHMPSPQEAASKGL